MRVVCEMGRLAEAQFVSITLDGGTKPIERGIVVGGAPAAPLATIDAIASGSAG